MKDVEQNLKESIKNYEALCNRGSANGDRARAEFMKIKNALRFMGKNYDTLTMARYGSERAISYIKKGYVPGFDINDLGDIIKTNKNEDEK